MQHPSKPLAKTRQGTLAGVERVPTGSPRS